MSRIGVMQTVGGHRGDIDVEGFMEYLTKVYDNRLEEAAQVVATHMRDIIATDYPPASTAGQPPHRRTGALQASVKVVKPRDLQRLVGADTRYALALELGRAKPKMAKRPFILRSFVETKEQVHEIIAGGESGQSGIRPFSASFAPDFAPGTHLGDL